MSALIVEIIGQGGSLSADGNAEITRQYIVSKVGTEAAAIEALYGYLLLTIGDPPNIGALVLDRIDAKEETLGTFQCTTIWRTYERRQRPATGESQFSFELGLEPVRVKIPIGGITVFKKDDAPDWEPELINDRGDGQEAEGVDIFEPTYEESETHWMPTEQLTVAYRQTLKSLVGRTNNAAFKGNQPGEALLRGISGTRRGAKDSELTFRWSVRENQNDLTVGGVTGISKKGWQFLWPRADTIRPDDAPALNQVTHVAVATVFREGDFSGLNIGTT